MIKKTVAIIFLLVIGFAVGVLFYQTDEEEHPGFTQDYVISNSEKLKSLLNQTGNLPSPVKNLIFIIGDGMGPQQIEFARLYAKKAPNSVVPGRQLAIEKLMDTGETGLVGVEPYDKLVPDSACAATQLSTGQYCRSEMIGLNFKGDPVPTILELAKQQEKSTGLVSDKRLTDATPAAYAAHQLHRSMENEIAVEMLMVEPDVMLSGGLRHFVPSSLNREGSEEVARLRKTVPAHIKLVSKRKDERNLLVEAQDRGYEVVFQKDQLEASESKNLLGLFTSSNMPDAITYGLTRDSPSRKIPSLKEMTVKAIEILSKNENGFFLMVEAAQIDFAGHSNDAGTLIHEMLVLDETLAYIMGWAAGRDDTLIILTADHETGSFGFSYSGYQIPEGKVLPGKKAKDKLFKPNYNFGDYVLLDKIYAQKKSFFSIMAEFDRLPDARKKPKYLQDLINTNVEFNITLKDASRILKTEQNPFYFAGHKHLGEKLAPAFDDFGAFYVHGKFNRTGLIGRAIATQQQTVWGTGTHTTTPVLVIAHGPKQWTQYFDGFHHNTMIGKLAMASLGLFR